MAMVDDDVSVLLQTYDALDAFLREMDTLDAVKSELAPPAVVTTSVSPTVSTLTPRKRKHACIVAPIDVSSDDTHERRPVRRRRQKEELLALREQALAMEAQLQRLRSSAALAAAHPPQQRPPASPSSQLWESCALFERRAKHAAVHENARLRGIASKELKVSFAIEKLLVKSYATAVRSCCHVWGMYGASDSHASVIPVCSWRVQTAFLPFGKNLELAFDAHNLELYEMLERSADARFHAIASAKFEFTAPVVTHASSHESRIVVTGDQETGVEFTRSHLYPFDCESVNEVSWNLITDDKHNIFTAKVRPCGFWLVLGRAPKILTPNTMGCMQHVRRSGDMMAIHSRFTVHREGESDLHMDTHTVIKRFRQQKRMMLTWEGMTQWTIADSDALILPTRETGWGVLEPVAGATQIWFCATTLSPKKAHGVGATSPNLLRDLIIPSTEQLMLAHNQLVENALLDASMRRK